MRNGLLSIVFVLLQLAPFQALNAQVASGPLGSPVAIVYDIKLIRDTDNLVASLGDNVQVWNYKTRALVTSWSASQIISISCLDNKVAGVSKSGYLFVWNASDGKELLHTRMSDSPLLRLVWLDNDHIVVGAENGELIKINVTTGQPVGRVTNAAAVTALAGNDDILISGDENGNISVYSTEDLKHVGSMSGHKTWIRDIALSTNSEGFVTTSDDGAYKTWKIGSTISNSNKHLLGNWVLCTDVAPSPNGDFDFFAFGKSNGDVIVDVKVATYTTKLDAMINSIAIIESELPQIAVALATHGQGIQLLNAKSMKLRKAR